jgi:hypothetical protein
VLTSTNIQPLDQLIRECESIQAFLEMDYDADNPASCEAKGKDLDAYMARTGKMLADAKYLQDQFTNSAISETIKEALSQQKVWSTTIINKKIDALCKDYNYAVNWCDRLNRSCTHSLDFIRTMISKHKAEMQMGGYGHGR